MIRLAHDAPLFTLALAGALLGVTAFGYAEDQPTSQQSSPDILLGPLFNDVQSAKLFPDQKTFADAVPKSDPLMIWRITGCSIPSPVLTCATSWR